MADNKFTKQEFIAMLNNAKYDETKDVFVINPIKHKNEDDSDWCLKNTVKPVELIRYSENNWDTFDKKNVLIYDERNVKKMLDLIKKDISSHLQVCSMDVNDIPEVDAIIKKRSGLYNDE